MASRRTKSCNIHIASAFYQLVEKSVAKIQTKEKKNNVPTTMCAVVQHSTTKLYRDIVTGTQIKKKMKNSKTTNLENHEFFTCLSR